MTTATGNEVLEFLKLTVGFRKGQIGLRGGKYLGADDFVLQHGREFPQRPLPEGVVRGPMKDCFRNAAHLLYEHPEYTYVEGYAAGMIPMLHAWCVDDEGFVVDNTWPEEIGNCYFGVPFNTRFVMRTLCERGYYGIIDNMEQGWPLLTGKATGWEADI